MKPISAVLLVAGLVVAPFTASAAVVFDAPVNFAATDGGAFSSPEQVLAGQFVVAALDPVRSATWFGTMLSTDPLDTGDTWNFDLVFRADDGAAPGDVLATRTVTATVVETTTRIGGYTLYRFGTAFSSVDLAAGSYYFSAINTGDPYTFSWTESTASGYAAFFNPGGVYGWIPLEEENRAPLNFTLYTTVPEPSAYALMALGLVAVGTAARRHQG